MVLLIFSILSFNILAADDIDEGERIEFVSANPFSFYHIITDLDGQEQQDAYGILRFPDNHPGTPFPLILGVNGSKNWADHHLEYLEMYRGMGYATFELHSFNSRDVKSTVGEQISVTTAMMVLDAYKAMETLAEDERLDMDAVAITGWSLGGGVALFAAWEPLISAIGVKPRFSAHLSIYPPCLVEMDLIDFSSAPIHILIGELDNWVTAAACEDLVADLRNKNVDINITVYPDSHHGFDREGPLTISEDGYSTVDCHFKMREDGALLMNFFEIPMITPFRQKISLGLCAERGTTLGGNPTSRKASFDFSKNFMKKHIGYIDMNISP